MTDILIVDDDSTVTEQITILLESYDYTPQFLLEAEYLMQMLGKHPIDLILLDIHMPGIDGLTLLKSLKNHPVYHSIPVIMLTADTDQNLLQECFDAGAQDFVYKPVKEVDLKARIKSALAICNQIREVEAINNLLKKTLEGMAEGVVAVDEHFQVRMISTNACRMLDIPEEKAMGKPVVSVLGTPIAGPSGVLVACLKNPGPTHDISTQLMAVSGVQTPVNLSVIPLEVYSSEIRWLLLFRDLRKEERLLREKIQSVTFGRMVSCDPKMNEIFALVEKVALSSAAIIIKGESGTGKELVAKEIHQRSRKAQGPFIAVNCAAISPNLMESEFFGHEQGAFTGASKRKPGRFELADKGTLFLDEVGDIPLDLQGKLLRVLQEQEFERVGGTRTIRVDVRIIAATNKNLQEMVHTRQFRDDLYYRLHVVPIYLPPLRERMQDIPLLVSFFIGELNLKERRKVQTIAPDALHLLLNHSWPGNIRELFNTIEYAFAVSEGAVLHQNHLPRSILDNPNAGGDEPALPMNEKELILQALQQANFSKPKAAALLGVHRTTLYRKIKKYGL